MNLAADLIALSGPKFPCGHTRAPENTRTCFDRNRNKRVERCLICQKARTDRWWREHGPK